ncbi:MAG: 5,6-dimethylbenzimidazole synthase [Chloroflexi bacterium]|nr:5,6-dimethylbenzimidazole synthase [Chloroflexota bacterium]
MASESLVQTGGFTPEEQRGLYRAIYSRRDIRTFKSDPIPPEVLARIIRAAHHGPSVGFMQPWDFVMVRDMAVRQRVKDLFDRERQAASSFFDEPRRSHYLSLKLEGILESAVNVCVTCDPTRAEVVLGRNSIQETDLYSTCCAVQNLWLAARAEGVGAGWVSILRQPQLRQILGIPHHVIPVAYLCLGYPVEFPPNPVLQTAGWRDRLELENLVHFDGWDEGPEVGAWETFRSALADSKESNGTDYDSDRK